MVVLAFVIQVPACRCGGEAVRVLGSETHARGLASMRDAECSASEEGSGGSC